MKTIRLLASFALWLAIGTVVQLAPRSRRRKRMDSGARR